MFRSLVASLLLLTVGCGADPANPVAGSPLFGTLGLHTCGDRISPDEAYGFAKGDAVQLPPGCRFPWRPPLDFAALPASAPWETLRAAAGAHHDPGRFTSLTALWVPDPAGRTGAGRTVILVGPPAPQAPPPEALPAAGSASAADVWSWMDGLRDAGIQSLAVRVPATSMGENAAPRDQRPRESPVAAQVRLRNEPLISSDHPALMNPLLLNGLALTASTGFNPFAVGAVGSAVTGAWVQSNDEDAISAALRRRETFATSGPKITLSAVAGFGLPGDPVPTVNSRPPDGATWVPMGGDLLGPAADSSAAPDVAIRGRADADSETLGRLQIVKGWLSNRGSHLRVYDVACAGGVAPDPATWRCPGASVEAGATSCTDGQAAGAAELAVLWQDPEFDPLTPAFYYAAAEEIRPCPKPPPGPAPQTPVPGRAWTSPIWYHPPAGPGQK